ncbi:MAG: TIGR03936 family radical SAM-associated protein [Clostridiales bacterium]|nr:TIGR03936 family radical SAM-associated protein [Clostridiales bacterium]
MDELRLKYSKTGAVKYISHLDITRCFARAFARAKIPIWFTEGYNPHPYMNFSPPLPLGVESESEFLDIRLSAEMAAVQIMARLNDTLPNGITITAAYSDFMPQSAIAFADYSFEIQFPMGKGAAAGNEIEKVLCAGEILAEKQKKKGKKRIVTEVNLKDMIISSSVTTGGDAVLITARLGAGERGNLSPVLLFDTLIKLINENYEFKRIRRLALFDKEYKEFK